MPLAEGALQLRPKFERCCRIDIALASCMGYLLKMGGDMKKFLLGATLLAMAGPAVAADMPVKAPIYKSAPIYSWSGLYAGAHFGAGWGTKEWDLTNASVAASGPDFTDFFGPGLTVGNFPVSFPINGFLGGVQAGYRVQPDKLVFGVEGSFSGADLHGSTNCFDFVCGSKVNWLATLSGQAGISLDHALLYVKAGGAWVNDKFTLDFGRCGTGFVCPGSSLTDIRSGWLVGAGAAYAIDPRWSVFIEYNYMDFGRGQAILTASEVSAGGSLVETRTFDIDQKLQVIKVGVNYQLNWAGPVVAKY